MYQLNKVIYHYNARKATNNLAYGGDSSKNACQWLLAISQRAGVVGAVS